MGSVAGWLSTIDALKDLDFGVVVPGRGPIGDGRIFTSCR
ncbi:unnamed protein product [Acidithrix sp. C25]|nr:unnamed protein product [Acidithrix sp. C25]